jgi:hypothetical protein
MTFDWKDVSEEGVLPQIQTPENYQLGYARGLAQFRESLDCLPAPVTRPEILKDLHKLLFGQVAP